MTFRIDYSDAIERPRYTIYRTHPAHDTRQAVDEYEDAVTALRIANLLNIEAYQEKFLTRYFVVEHGRKIGG